MDPCNPIFMSMCAGCMDYYPCLHVNVDKFKRKNLRTKLYVYQSTNNVVCYKCICPRGCNVVHDVRSACTNFRIMCLVCNH